MISLTKIACFRTWQSPLIDRIYEVMLLLRSPESKFRRLVLALVWIDRSWCRALGISPRLSCFVMFLFCFTSSKSDFI